MIVTHTTTPVYLLSFCSRLTEALIEDDGVGDRERDDASSSNGDEGNHIGVGYYSSYL